jgi:DNA-binding transcriptional MerR regulator
VAEVATALGVRERTVHTWIREGMPGRPGLPGRREGHFPLDEIEAWAATRRSPGEDDPDTSKAQAQSRRLLAQAKLAELEYDRRRGQLVDADEMSRRWLRHIFEVKAQSKQLTTRVMQRLPPAIDTPTRTRIRQEIDRSLAQMFLAMQSFLLSEADDAEQPTEQSTEQPTDQTPAATPPTTKTGPSHAKPHRKKKRSTLAKKTS